MENKRGTQLKGKIVFLIIVIIALVGTVYYLFGDIPEGLKRLLPDFGDGRGISVEPVVDGGTAGGKNGNSGGSGKQGVDEPQSPEGIDALWYYDAAHMDRYKAFEESRPDLSIDKVVWMVEANLDKPAYEYISEVPDPLSLTLLVNKYFFLPENFRPSDLVAINSMTMRAEAAAAMNEMIGAAAAEGHRLWVQSGFRSYSTQVNLYNQYSANDGTDVADTHSARPGHSEHQSGLTADLNTITEAFGNTPEGIWTAENCWKYGFIVRYTEENTELTLYKPEPWHLRYVGPEAADIIHKNNILAYEEYWVKYVINTPPSQG